MSVANQIQRLMQAKSDIATAIAAKGVTVPESAKLDEYPALIEQIPTGGGSFVESDVNFYDYDGTLVASYTLDEAHNLTTLPTPPAHDGLTFQKWNYTLAKINATTGKLNVGATYITSDGKTHLNIRLTKVSGLSVTLYLNKSDSSTLTVDWGDSTTSTFTNSGNFNTGAHTYPSVGDYTIKLWISSGSGTYGFGHGPSSVYLLGDSTVQQTLISSFVGNNVTSIGSYAFTLCRSLTSITIPDGVTSISSSYAFNNCNSLTSIAIPDSVTSIGSYAFYSCSSLTSIAIPDSVTSIDSYAFNGCSSLTSITIPDSVTSIGSYAFSYCSSLTSITIPDGVTSISSSAFNNCYSLTSITIPDGVTSIGSYAFAYCYSLTSITIPDGVTSISGNAFYSCSSIKQYIIERSAPPTLSNSNAFNGIVPCCYIYVPAASLNAYKTATNWSVYADYMVGM